MPYEKGRPPKYGPDMLDAIVKARVEEGLQYKQLEARFGVSNWVVARALNRAGLVRPNAVAPKAKPTPERSLLPGDIPEWIFEGGCAGTDPELFFPEKGNSHHAQARAICADCPVREACLSWALETRQSHGIWGGTTVNERRRILAAIDSAEVA